MKKANKILSSLCLMTASAAIGMFAANDTNGSGKAASLSEFKDTTIEAEIGTRYQPDITAVKDSKGNEHPVVIRAYNEKEEEIGSTDGGFQITDFGGYTVKYTADMGNKEEIRTVKVNVTDSTAPELKILGLRTEREVGTIAWPYVNVTDNSGEKLDYSIDVVGLEGVGTPEKTDDYVTFKKPGKYKFVATAKDSKGNEGKAEKEIIITESMGDHVWENFDNANHMETVKNTTFLTSMTQSSWLAEYEGAQGVAKIQPNYSRYYNNNFFVQLGLPKTKDEILSCDWSNFKIRMWLDVKGADTIRLSNGDGFVFGDYKTNEWIELKVNRGTYLDKKNNYMFPKFLGDEDYDTRSEAFAEAVTSAIPRPMFSVSVGSLLNSIQLSDVTIYIDQITWEDLGPDTEAPTIRLNGASWKVNTNTEMTLPTIEVTDDRDNKPKYEAKFYKVNDNGIQEIPIVANKVQIGGEGQYKLVVYAVDKAGNSTQQEFIFTAMDVIDFSDIATFENASELGIFGLYSGNGSITYEDSYTDKDGVTKNGLMKLTFDGNAGAEVVTLTLPQATSDAMKDGGFDYVEFTVCVGNEKDSYNGSYGGYSFYSLNTSIPDYRVTALACRKWYTVRFSLDELAKPGSYLSENNSYTVDRARTAFLGYYTGNTALFFNMSSWFFGQTVEMYVDSITWGVFEADTKPPEITGNGVWKAEKGKSYTIPTFTAIDERDGEVEIESVAMYKEGSTTELDISKGKITLNESGNYTIVVKAVDASGNRAEKKFTVMVVDQVNKKSIATYDTESELGVLTLMNGKNGISWVDSFTDTDGETKNGLMKLSFSGNAGADIVLMSLPQEIADKMKAGRFEYIDITLCVNNNDAYNGEYGGYTLYSFNKSIPAYGVGSSLLCKKWQTVRISLADLNDATSYLGSYAGIDEARNAFLGYYAGNEGYFFNMSDWFRDQTIEMYIDSIVWGTEGEGSVDTDPDTPSLYIEAVGRYRATVNKTYYLPEFTAYDSEDGEIEVESVNMYKKGSRRALTVRNGKIVLTEEGRYSIVVTATNSAGTTIEEIYTVICQVDPNTVPIEDPITGDDTTIAVFNNENDLGILSLTNTADGISWVHHFTDSSGVTKQGLMKLTFSGNNLAEVVRMNLPQAIADKMRAGEFDYIDMTICVDNIDSYNGAYGGYTLYSFNKSIPAYGVGSSLLCKKWQTVRISLDDLNVSSSYLGTSADPRAAFLGYYVNNDGNFFNLSSWFDGQTVTMYVDTITWGANDIHDPITDDDTTIAVFNNATDNGNLITFEEGTGGVSVEWVRSLTDANNVKKEGLLKLTFGNGGAGIACLNLPTSFKDAMTVGQFDYIDMVVYVEQSGAYSGQYSLYSFNKSVPDYATNDFRAKRWETIRITLADLNDPNTYLTQYPTIDRAREVFLGFYCNNAGRFFNLSSWFGNESKVEMYIDSITWGKDLPDTIPPVISVSNAVWSTLKGEEYTLPTFTATDDRDGSVAIQSVAITKENDTTELTITDGKVTFAEAGRYTIVVTAVDAAGNEARETFTVTVTEFEDQKLIAGFDKDSDLSVFGLRNNTGSITLVDSFQGRDGVVKLTFNGNNGAEVVTFSLPAAAAAAMQQGNFDFIEMWVYMDADSNWGNSYNSNVYSLYSKNKSLPEYNGASAPQCRNWQKIVISLEDLISTTHPSYLNEGAAYTVDQARNIFIGWYGQGNANFFHTSSWFSGEITMYIDSMRWGNSKEIATYDNMNDLGVLSLKNTADGISWIESYTDKDGVTKNGLMKLSFSGNGGAEVVKLNLSSQIMSAMIAANFDYIDLTVCVGNENDSYNGQYGGWSFYSSSKSIPDYNTNPLRCRTWYTVRFSLEDLRNAGSYLSGGNNYSAEEARNAFSTYHAEGGEGYFFDMNSWFGGQTVELYVDSIVWGVN